MFLDSPPTRNTHIVRIFGTNKKKDVLQGMWLDVERMDTMESIVSGDGSVRAYKNPIDSLMGQGFVRNFHWRDDPVQDDYLEGGNPNGDWDILKICDPTVKGQNFDDPDEWIPLPVAKTIRALNSRDNYQEFVEKFLTDELNEARDAENRRVYHHDTSIDKLVNAATKGNSSLKAFVFDLKNNKSQYDLDVNTKDEGQYVEFSVIKQLGHLSASDASRVGGSSDRVLKLLNDYLLDITEPAKMKELGPQGFNPPYILDPYQNIVNVSFGGLAVKFLKKDL